MDINSLEPNAHRYRQAKIQGEKEETPPKKHVEKVISGNATVRRRSLGRKFIDIFFNGDITDVKSYLIFDVLVPSIKETINSLINKGTEMILFGETTKSVTKKSTSSGTYVSYGSPYRGERERLPSSNRNRVLRRFDDIKFENRGDAENVLDTLAELMDIYHQATVGDFYDAVGITNDWTEDVDNYGWTDISGARVSRVRDGYILEMPKCTKL